MDPTPPRPARATFVALIATLTIAFSVAPAADAGHGYDQHVWLKWNEWELDVLVLGVDDPIIGRAINDAVESWREGIAQYGAPWFADNMTMHVYFPADNPVPPTEWQGTNVDILVVPQGYMAAQTSARCVAMAPFVGYGLATSYRVAAHEIGHCLGLGHVFNHGSEYSPGFDIMGSASSARACPSNLNIDVMERAFGHLAGQPSGGWVHQAASGYEQAIC